MVKEKKEGGGRSEASEFVVNFSFLKIIISSQAQFPATNAPP